MGRYAQLAYAASDMCMKDAAIELTDEDRERCGTIIGVGIGGLEWLYAYSVQLRDKGPEKVSPYFIPNVIANLAAGQVAMALGLRGTSYCTTSACSSSAHAIGEAYEWIRRGRSKIMLVGGAEAAITGLGIGGFGAMYALSRRNDEPARASRPWDKGRDGFVCGEGAASLLLESLSHAKKRGAKIYAELTGYGASCDAYHLTKPAPEGRGAQRAMKQALVDAGLTPADVDYVNAHGTSTQLNDRAETVALKAALGPRAGEIPVSSTKSAIGHLLGAAGAVEAIATVEALRRRTAPPTVGWEERDEGLDLDYVPGSARPIENGDSPLVAISDSFGFGGHNAVLCLAA
jgi:3-oxoacyl-[acyl-carrier-protein] synthase II